MKSPTSRLRKAAAICAPSPLAVYASRIAFAALLSLICTSLYAQQGGVVTFGNNNSAPVINGQTASPVTTTDNIRAALYWAPFGSNNFVQIGATIDVGIPLPGLFAGGTRTTGSPAGAYAQFQVRAWGGGYSNYEQAATHSGVLLGQSGILQVPTGNPVGTPPTPPPSLVANGLQSFTLTTNSSSGSSLSLTCASGKTVQCGSAWDFDPPTASDFCGNTNITITALTVTNGTCPQSITRTWLAIDTCNNNANCSQTVTVVDNTPPSLACATNKTVQCGDAWTFDAPSVLDSCAGTNVTMTLLGVVTNVLCPQIITATWLAMDLCGNSNTCSQRVTLICPSCPVLQLTKLCPPNPVPPGGILVFTGTVTNAGDLPLTNVLVVNDKPGPNTVVFGPVNLGPGAGAIFTGSYTVPACSCGPFNDTLSASGTSSDGLSVTNFITVACAGTNYAVPGDLNGDGIVDQNELNAVLANYWSHSPWISMTNPTTLGGGRFQFALTNATGWNFTVLVSSNLVDWTNLPGPAYPVYQFLDPDAGTNPFRFYRLRWPPK